MAEARHEQEAGATDKESALQAAKALYAKCFDEVEHFLECDMY